MPFESPNYTQIPNDLFDNHLKDMGYAELKVVLAVMRYTFGYHRSKARISLTKIQQMTGLSRQGVLDGAEMAEKHGFLERIHDGGVTSWVVKLLDHLVKLLDQSGQVTRPPSIKENNKEKRKKGRQAVTPGSDSKYDHIPWAKA